MSGWLVLLALVLILGVVLQDVEERRSGRPEDINFGRLGRGVLVALVIVLAVGSLSYLLVRLIAYEPDECTWGLWPLGPSCRNIGPSDPSADPVGWFPTAAVVGFAVAVSSIGWSDKRRRRT